MAEIELLCIGNAMVDVFAEVSGDTLRNIRERFGLAKPVQHVSAETAAAILDALPQLRRSAAGDGIETVAERLFDADPTACLSGKEFQKSKFPDTFKTGFYAGASEGDSHLVITQKREAIKNQPQMVISSGGGAANTAKIAAKLGVKTAFAGCTGAERDGEADFFGTIFENELSATGVQTLLRKVNKPTGVFINLAAGGEKTIAASPSAALELGAEDLRGFLPESENGADSGPKILMFEGFLMERPVLVRRCFKIAEQCGAILAFDPGTAGIAAYYAADILGWRAGNERRFVLFANEAEAEALAAHGGNPAGPDERDSVSGWETLFSRLCAKTAGLLVAVKLAERGAVVFADGEVYRIETRPVAGAESTGAGDVFAAGFLAALLRGESLVKCGRAGNTAAVLVLRNPGTGISVTTATRP